MSKDSINQWDDDYWDEIVFNIAEGNCILMLGPDASLEKSGSKTIPISKLLSLELAKQSVIKSTIQKWKIKPDNLTQVSLAYTLERKAGKSKLLQKVQAFYKERTNNTNEVYTHLAELPFPLTVTTTPDKMFSNSLRKSGKKPYEEFYNYKGEETDIPYDYSVENPLVYNLYGSVEDSHSLILTEDDVLDFLVSITDKTPSVPSEILTELRNNEKTILFVGFGFENWYLRILLRILQIENKESPSYALEHLNSDNIDNLHNMIIYYGHSNFKIQVCNYDINKFAMELQKRFAKAHPEKMAGFKSPEEAEDIEPVKKRKSKGAISANVFISYASEDEKIAKKVHDELKKVGANPWWDKKKLRGGDDWDSMIESRLDDADYMVLIVSDNLHKKIADKSYVVKEINQAIDGKQLQTMDPEKFIIPATVNEAKHLPSLKKIQAVAIGDGKDVKSLISVITDDIKRRQNG
ncbi:MAG: toll/interleukin-1 receptor domain-containing protein [Leptospirales bacterium]